MIDSPYDIFQYLADAAKADALSEECNKDFNWCVPDTERSERYTGILKGPTTAKRRDPRMVRDWSWTPPRTIGEYNKLVRDSVEFESPKHTPRSFSPPPWIAGLINLFSFGIIKWTDPTSEYRSEK